MTTERLAAAGVIWPEDEAAQLREAAGGDPARLERLLARRERGEPLAWITGRTVFCGMDLYVEPGVYVPRAHTEPLARRVAHLLPTRGTALDPCTGSGAVAAVMAVSRPGARVLCSDIDERSVACARRNGVRAVQGELLDGFPPEVAGRADVITAVVPYVPTSELGLLHRDTFAFETATAYDGGADGLAVMRRLAADSLRWLRAGGVLLVEIGDGQADAVGELFDEHGYGRVRPVGDHGEERVRALEAVAG